MGEPNYLTPRGLARIRDELEQLQTAERPKVVAEVAYAASLGDRSENAEYIYGKKRLREIDSRMRYLMKRLDHVVVLDPASLTGKVVRFGATVVLEDEDGAVRTWRIYGEDEVDVDRGIISHKAPLSRALMGRREGDAVEFQAPAGRREYAILEVRYEAQTSDVP